MFVNILLTNKHVHETKMEGTLPASFYEVSIIIILKQDKGATTTTTKKEKTGQSL
jgi:hypothetical protein